MRVPAPSLLFACVIPVAAGCLRAADPAADAVRQVVASSTAALTIPDAPVTDHHLQPLRGLKRLTTVKLGNACLTAAGAASLRDEPLTEVVLEGCRVDDAILRELCRHRSLRVLNLPDAVVTDAGLVALEPLDRLELLRLGSDRLTDAGLISLTRLPSLRWLIINDAPITDDGLPTLAGLRRLESLYLFHTSVSEEGLDRLRHDRPTLHMHWE